MERSLNRFHMGGFDLIISFVRSMLPSNPVPIHPEPKEETPESPVNGTDIEDRNQERRRISKRIYAASKTKALSDHFQKEWKRRIFIVANGKVGFDQLPLKTQTVINEMTTYGCRFEYRIGGTD